MPRPIVLGNGNLLVQIDHRGNLRDLSWPIGIWNHLSGRAIRTGVWVDGSFAWLDSYGWDRDHWYTVRADTLVAHEKHTRAELGLVLEFEEWVDPFEDLFIREIAVVNTRANARSVRLFFAQDLRIMESDIGDCVLWHPGLNGLIHFKGQCAVLMRTDDADQFACGITGFGGAEGTWRDAEDGNLQMNPIAQGSVDSTLGTSLDVPGSGSATCRYEIVFAGSIDDLEDRDQEPRADSPMSAGSPSNRVKVSDPELHCRIIDTQCSKNGAILAANDSDIMQTNRANYSSCWVRDGAHVAEAVAPFDRGERARAFVNWALPLLDRRPYFLQKYRADGAFGASWHPWTRELPIQLDETASFLSLLFSPCLDRKTRSNAAPTAARLVAFLHDHQEDHLPLPSYDLWEERWGIHIYTVCTVINALRDAGQDASPMVSRLVSTFYHNGAFMKSADDPRLDASSLFVGLFGILPIHDPMVQSNAEQVRRALWASDGIGGLARYPGDYYFRVDERNPGNPWIICTLWLAQHEAMSGRMHRAEELFDWVHRYADPSGVLPEQLHPETGEHLSVSPLTWSHAEYLRTWSLLNQ